MSGIAMSVTSNPTGAVPAIAVSAYVRDEDRTRALSAGFDADCVKPLDTAAFVKAIRAVLLT